MISGGVVPAAVESRVTRVSATVRDTMPRLRNLGLGSPEAYSVMATATDYLPEAIGGYTRLPRRWADSRPIENGKTSLMLLIDQLDLLGATMDKIFDAVVRVDADALIAHGRFLQEKFGHASTGGDARTSASSSPLRRRAAPWTCRDRPRQRRDEPDRDRTRPRRGRPRAAGPDHGAARRQPGDQSRRRRASTRWT